MGEIFYRKSTLDLIANRLLKTYQDGKYLFGAPQSVPIEQIIELEYGLNIEYVCLRKNGTVLGQTVFENCFVPFYDTDNEQYSIMEVQPGTILIDISLIENENSGRLRFTLAHELAHWLIHQKIFEDSQQSAAKIDGNIDSQTEWQADTLAALILMPKMQIKKAFYKITNLNKKDKISYMTELFNVSKQAMTICLKSHNMI